MASDDPRTHPIKGDVIPDSIKRISGQRGSTDGLIEIALVGHPHRYRVRIELNTASPRSVRRLAKAAARFIGLTERKVSLAGDFEDPTNLIRPDHEPGGRTLDDVHYRQVANLITTAREWGLSPREHVAAQLRASLPTVDRWIKEAKNRGFLPRNWSTNNGAELE
jgi:hypothetical protein